MKHLKTYESRDVMKIIMYKILEIYKVLEEPIKRDFKKMGIDVEISTKLNGLRGTPEFHIYQIGSNLTNYDESEDFFDNIYKLVKDFMNDGKNPYMTKGSRDYSLSTGHLPNKEGICDYDSLSKEIKFYPSNPELMDYILAENVDMANILITLFPIPEHIVKKYNLEHLIDAKELGLL